MGTGRQALTLTLYPTHVTLNGKQHAFLASGGAAPRAQGLEGEVSKLIAKHRVDLAAAQERASAEAARGAEALRAAHGEELRRARERAAKVHMRVGGGRGAGVTACSSSIEHVCNRARARSACKPSVCGSRLLEW